MTRRCQLLLAALAAMLLCLGASATAADPSDPGTTLTPQTAFEKLTQLGGSWAPVEQDSAADDHSPVLFRVTAAGSAVMATFFAGTEMEMISMFHLDGPDRLLHTHYCALGNQPRMRFEACDEPNTLKMVFDGGTNMDAEVDLHVHEMTLRFVDENTIESETVAFAEGKPANVRQETFVRDSGE